MTKKEIEKKSIHKWERLYKMKVLFMLPGQKNRKLTKEKFADFIRGKSIQLTVDHYSLDEKTVKEVV